VTPSRVEVFGLTLDPLSLEAAAQQVLDWIRQDQPISRFVVTPNVNHVVLFQNNSEFQRAYGEASLVLADGRYIVWASRLLGRSLPESVNGSDLVPAIFERAKTCGELSVFLLGAMPGVGEEAANQIRHCWPWVKVVGTYSPEFGFENSVAQQEKMIAAINKARPELVVVGLSPPKQEIWIANSIRSLQCQVAICAGATIDFLAGSKPRAPIWMQKFGLEWIFRIVTEPRRLLPRYLADGLQFLRLMVREAISSRSRDQDMT
jgi:N-acetylglucosaminyldiphosphoundecaprenol N-acetyl-beta-D-mannosaminyltransferase